MIPPTLAPLDEHERARRTCAHLIAHLMRLVAINAYVAWMAGASSQGDYYRKVAMRSQEANLQPGDVVVEWSTVRRWAAHADDTVLPQYPGLGILLRRTREPMWDAADPANADRGEPPLEAVVYLQPLDGSVPEYRWVNASFFRVLTALNLDDMAV